METYYTILLGQTLMPGQVPQGLCSSGMKEEGEQNQIFGNAMEKYRLWIGHTAGQVRMCLKFTVKGRLGEHPLV